MKNLKLTPLFLLAIVMAISTGNAFAQSKLLSFTKSKNIESANSAEIYKKAKSALSTSFSESNLQLLELEEDGGVYIKGNSTVEFSTKDPQLKTVASGFIGFTFEVEVNNEQAILTLSNFIHLPQNSKYNFGQLTTDAECPQKVGGTMKKSRINVWTELKSTAKETADVLLKNFTESLGKKADGGVALAAQKSVQGVPADLKTVGIVFLKHEMAEIDENPDATSVEKRKNANKRMHNKLAAKANAEIDEVVKKYPYKYVVANSRAELDELYKKGYKYVLDCMAYDNMKKGNFKSSAKVQYFYELYVKDLSTNTQYIITDNLAERSVYNFNLMVAVKLMSAIED